MNLESTHIANPFHQRFAIIIALATSILTIFTFIIAIMTPPLSGPFCAGDCFEYPYLDIAERFPRDYLWMFPAIILTLLYLVLVTSLYEYAPLTQKIFGRLGLAFAVIATGTLVVNYFVQISVIQPSVLRGEADGISILTQYNDHGLFIALEEIGYILMSLSFLCLAGVFTRGLKGEGFMKWMFIASFILVMLSLLIISIIYGTERSYIFEIVVISVNWLVLIIGGFLLAGVFGRVG